MFLHYLLIISYSFTSAIVEPATLKTNNNNATFHQNMNILYDFTSMHDLRGWKESSDTVRTPGMSKASFVLQKTQLYQRAIFFSLLNPQPNGAGFAGYYKYDEWDLSNFTSLVLFGRAQGENYHYKIVLRHKDDPVDDITYSYETFFELPRETWTEKRLPFDSFQAYYRGKLVPDAEKLDPSRISSVGIQIVGGVYSDYKQSGASSLEINYIGAV